MRPEGQAMTDELAKRLEEEAGNWDCPGTGNYGDGWMGNLLREAAAALSAARAEALEEAYAIAWNNGHGTTAEAIRALKDKP